MELMTSFPKKKKKGEEHEGMAYNHLILTGAEKK